MNGVPKSLLIYTSPLAWSRLARHLRSFNAGDLRRKYAVNESSNHKPSLVPKASIHFPTVAILT